MRIGWGAAGRSIRQAARWGRRHAARIVASLAALVLLISSPWLWTRISASGHLFGEHDAPSAEVVIVFGTEVAADRRTPASRLAGRLRTAAALVHSGRARVILVSGDGNGQSGNEPEVMTRYLTEQLGIAPGAVIADRFGLDTYDTCARAHDRYGVSRALLVTQSYHLPRAVTLCRRLGITAEGVRARCPGCGSAMLAEKGIREYFASGKAALDAVRRRPPAVRGLVSNHA